MDRSNDRGVALVVTLLTMLILVLIGFGLLVGSQGGIRVENGLKSQTTAFEIADAGIEYAREKIRKHMFDTCSSPCDAVQARQALTALLTTARNGGSLVNSDSLVVFPSITGVGGSIANIPFVDTTSFESGAFKVFITNDRAETGGGVTRSDDTNGHVTLTSFGSGANGVGFAALQAEVKLPLFDVLPDLPGTLVLPGPNVTFLGNNSNAYHMANTSPNCAATIAVTSALSVTSVTTELALRLPNYTTCNPDDGSGLGGAQSVTNFINNDPTRGGSAAANPYQIAPNSPAPLPIGDPAMTTVDYYTHPKSGLIDQIKAVADYRATTDTGFTLGNTSDPKFVVINGDYSLGPSGGAGILLVTGNLTIDGAANYTGLIFAIGAGHVSVSGSGNGGLNGAMMVVNTATPAVIVDPTAPGFGSPAGTYVGIPYFDGRGGGTGTWAFNKGSTDGDGDPQYLAPVRLWFQLLRVAS